MEDPRLRTVRRGYDQLAKRYLTWASRIEGDPRSRYVTEFADRLEDGALVLDLGCGSGLPTTRLVAQRFAVVGVDISEAQLRIAAENVPQASLVLGDLSRPGFRSQSFDGVVALYSIPHVPRDAHGKLFGRIHNLLVPGGLFLASLSSGDSPDWTGEWLGTEMFFSGHDAETNSRLLREEGFRLLLDDVVEMKEPQGPAAFQWILARAI